MCEWMNEWMKDGYKLCMDVYMCVSEIDIMPTDGCHINIGSCCRIFREGKSKEQTHAHKISVLVQCD